MSEWPVVVCPPICDMYSLPLRLDEEGGVDVRVSVSESTEQLCGEEARTVSREFHVVPVCPDNDRCRNDQYRSICFGEGLPGEPLDCEECRGDGEPRIEAGIRDLDPYLHPEVFVPLEADGTVELYDHRWDGGQKYLLPLAVRAEGICWETTTITWEVPACPETNECGGRAYPWDTSEPGVEYPEPLHPTLCAEGWPPLPERITLRVTVSESELICGGGARSVTDEVEVAPVCPPGDDLCREMCFGDRG